MERVGQLGSAPNKIMIGVANKKDTRQQYKTEKALAINRGIPIGSSSRVIEIKPRFFGWHAQLQGMPMASWAARGGGHHGPSVKPASFRVFQAVVGFITYLFTAGKVGKFKFVAVNMGVISSRGSVYARLRVRACAWVGEDWRMAW